MKKDIYIKLTPISTKLNKQPNKFQLNLFLIKDNAEPALTAEVSVTKTNEVSFSKIDVISYMPSLTELLEMTKIQLKEFGYNFI